MSTTIDEKKVASLALPVTVGCPSEFGTHNASMLYDANHEAFCAVYGIPLHSTLEEVDPVKFAEGLARATKIVRCINEHDSLVRREVEMKQALLACANLIEQVPAGSQSFGIHPHFVPGYEGQNFVDVLRNLTLGEPK